MPAHSHPRYPWITPTGCPTRRLPHRSGRCHGLPRDLSRALTTAHCTMSTAQPLPVLPPLFARACAYFSFGEYALSPMPSSPLLLRVTRARSAHSRSIVRPRTTGVIFVIPTTTPQNSGARPRVCAHPHCRHPISCATRAGGSDWSSPLALAYPRRHLPSLPGMCRPKTRRRHRSPMCMPTNTHEGTLRRPRRRRCAQSVSATNSCGKIPTPLADAHPQPSRIMHSCSRPLRPVNRS